MEIVDLDPKAAAALHDQVFGHHDTYSDPQNWGKYSVVIGNAEGFVAGRKKEGQDYPHLSLAGVLDSARGKGVFTALVREFARRFQTDHFSITTYPERFPVMAKWVRKKAIRTREVTGKLDAVVAL